MSVNKCEQCRNYRVTNGVVDPCPGCWNYDKFNRAYTLADLQAAQREAFFKGAKFWEFYSTGGTMWQSDQRIVGDEAEKRYPADGPIETRAEIEAKERERCVDAVIEVIRGRDMCKAIYAIRALGGKEEGKS